MKTENKNMAKKSKLEQILETYSEDEIREICAESTSRTDFAKRLGINYKTQHKFIYQIIEKLDLNINHFAAPRQRTPSEKEARAACRNANSYKEMASLLNLKYKSDNALYAGIYRIIHRYHLDNSHFYGVPKQERIDRIVPTLSLEEVEKYRYSATSYQNLAELCGCKGNPNQLHKQGKKIASVYDLKKTDFAKNRKEAYFQNSYATDMKLSSWIWHHRNLKCSQCGCHIENIGFLSTDINKLHLGEIKDHLICPTCHKNLKQKDIKKTRLQLIPMTHDNKTKCGIYLMRNIATGLLYVGETKDSFHNRIDRHITNGKTNKPAQKLEEAITEYGEKNFEFYILEIISKKKSQKYFFEREDYWMDCLGTKNPLIGYNDYRSPSNHKVLSNAEIVCFLTELQNSDRDLYDIASDYEITRSAAGRMRLGQRRKQPGISYPVYSKKEREQFSKILLSLNLLQKTSMSFKEISKQTEISSSVLGKYNVGKLPKLAIEMLGADLSEFVFPLRDTTTNITKNFKSKYHEKEIKIATGTNESTLKNADADKIFHQVLESSFKEVGREYHLSDQAIRKFLAKRDYPVRLEDIIVWLDEHPEVYSNKRIPPRQELFDKLNQYGKNKTAQMYNVHVQTIERWSKYRKIKIHNTTQNAIYLKEFNIEINTCAAVAEFLIEKGIGTAETCTKNIIRHSIERYGVFNGIHMNYIEKPIAEYE